MITVNISTFSFQGFTFLSCTFSFLILHPHIFTHTVCVQWAGLPLVVICYSSKDGDLMWKRFILMEWISSIEIHAQIKLYN